MSTKRKSTAGKKNRAKSRKVEYDEEDISSEHDSEVDDAEAGSNADGEDAVEDALADVSNMPELPAPEVIPLSLSYLLGYARDATRRDAQDATRPLTYYIGIRNLVP